MIRLILVAALFLLTASHTSVTAPQYPDIGTAFPLHWKADMGQASYRNNIVLTNDHIVIGSNGKNFIDYSIYDKRSGVYFIDRKKGAVSRHFANDQFGDMDVAGILVHDKRCYFGNDNEDFLCTDLKGNIIWRNQASGDIEHEPLLVKGRQGDMIVYASETGEVRAVNPLTGNKIWNYYTPDFDGYKAGDNRMVFKVKAYMSSYSELMLKPLLVDLNQDGVSDLIYLTKSGNLFALNGQSGALLWRFRPDGIHISSFISSPSYRDTRLVAVGYSFNSNDYGVTQYMISINGKGEFLEQRKLFEGRSGQSITQLTINDDTTLYNYADSIYFIKNGKIARSVFYQQPGEMGSEVAFYREAVFGRQVFSFEGHERCVLLLNQNRFSSSNNSQVEIISLDDGELIRRLSLPAYSEMPPEVVDVNKDGKLDVLINCSDGYLYCYNLQIKASH